MQLPPPPVASTEIASAAAPRPVVSTKAIQESSGYLTKAEIVLLQNLGIQPTAQHHTENPLLHELEYSNIPFYCEPSPEIMNNASRYLANMLGKSIHNHFDALLKGSNFFRADSTFNFFVKSLRNALVGPSRLHTIFARIHHIIIPHFKKEMDMLKSKKYFEHVYYPDVLKKQGMPLSAINPDLLDYLFPLLLFYGLLFGVPELTFYGRVRATGLSIDQINRINQAQIIFLAAIRRNFFLMLEKSLSLDLVKALKEILSSHAALTAFVEFFLSFYFSPSESTLYPKLKDVLNSVLYEVTCAISLNHRIIYAVIAVMDKSQKPLVISKEFILNLLESTPYALMYQVLTGMRQLDGSPSFFTMCHPAAQLLRNAICKDVNTLFWDVQSLFSYLHKWYNGTGSISFNDFLSQLLNFELTESPRTVSAPSPGVRTLSPQTVATLSLATTPTAPPVLPQLTTPNVRAPSPKPSPPTPFSGQLGGLVAAVPKPHRTGGPAAAEPVGRVEPTWHTADGRPVNIHPLDLYKIEERVYVSLGLAKNWGKHSTLREKCRAVFEKERGLKTGNRGRSGVYYQAAHLKIKFPEDVRVWFTIVALKTTDDQPIRLYEFSHVVPKHR